jgi:hypothetical protein
MTEWKTVPWCTNYEVSDDGRIRRGDRELKQRLSTTGYPTVMFGHTGQARPRKVHRLVMEAFSRPAVEGDVVNHLDGDKTNNHRSNLEYTTRAGNIAHAMEHGLIRSGIDHGMAKLTAAQVVEIRARFAAGERGQSIADAFGINRNYAYQIKRNEERAA